MNATALQSKHGIFGGDLLKWVDPDLRGFFEPTMGILSGFAFGISHRTFFAYFFLKT